MPITLLLCPVSGLAQSTLEYFIQDDYDLRVLTNWESHYVTEGRDNLDTKSLQSTIIEAKFGSLGILIWNGWGYDSEYDELNIIPYLSYDKNDISIYLSYNRKQFFVTSESDNEIGSGISWHGVPHDIFLGFDWYYSFDATGSFFEFSTGSEFEPVDKLGLETLFIFGINDNYISDGHDGANHFSFQLNGEYSLTNNINMLGYIRYNAAIDSDPMAYTGDNLLRNFFWGGIGISVSF